MTSDDCIVVPTTLVWCHSKPVITLAKVNIKYLKLPFWDQTLAHATDIVGLVSLDDIKIPSDLDQSLGGFIYHMWRCGSTLVARLLNEVNNSVALSEPFIFQQLLDTRQGTANQRIIWLRKLMALHCIAFKHKAKLSIKWSGLMALYAHEIHQAFPSIPALFLHRDPIEVLVSIRDRPLGNFKLMSAWHLNIDEKLYQQMTRLEQVAFLISCLCESLLQLELLHILSYTQLPEAILENIIPLFGLTATPMEKEQMAAAAQFNAKKRKKQLFVNDSVQKQDLADNGLIALAKTVLEEPLKKLCTLHNAV